MIGSDRQKNLIREFATVSDEAFALLVLENIWDKWIKMDPLEFFSRKKMFNNRQHNTRNNKQEENGQKNHMVHSSFVVGVWMELNNSMNFA